MKKILFVALVSGLSFSSNAQVGASALIPAPLQVQEKDELFTLTNSIQIIAPAVLKGPANLLAAEWGLSTQNTSVKKPVKSGRSKIVFAIATAHDTLGTEGYKLDIQPSVIYITAQTGAGALQGILTLLQLQQLQPDMQKNSLCPHHRQTAFFLPGITPGRVKKFLSPAFYKKIH